VQRVAIIATASGCGKTTVGRKLAARLDVPYVELDAIHWQAGWTELDSVELRRRVEPLVERDAWVIDGSYRG
jgi:adenylate kinase family enzyme